MLFLLFQVVLASMFSKNYLQKFTLSYLIIFVSAASIYSLIVIYHTTSEKEREHQKLLAVTLVADRDPAAEVFLSEIQQEISRDSVIPSLLIQEEGLHTIILNKPILAGISEDMKFEFLFVPAPIVLYIEMEDRTEPCFAFFRRYD